MTTLKFSCDDAGHSQWLCTYDKHVKGLFWWKVACHSWGGVCSSCFWCSFHYDQSHTHRAKKNTGPFHYDLHFTTAWHWYFYAVIISAPYHPLPLRWLRYILLHVIVCSCFSGFLTCHRLSINFVGVTGWETWIWAGKQLSFQSWSTNCLGSPQNSDELLAFSRTYLWEFAGSMENVLSWKKEWGTSIFGLHLINFCSKLKSILSEYYSILAFLKGGTVIEIFFPG